MGDISNQLKLSAAQILIDFLSETLHFITILEIALSGFLVLENRGQVDVVGIPMGY